jgi:hypothetical protein
MPKIKFKFGGVNNVMDSAEVGERVDRFAPYTEMVSGSNIDISDRMAARRRKGYSRVSSTLAHSLWANAAEDQAYFVFGSTLYRLNLDYTETAIVALLSDAPMAFAEVNDAIVYSNDTDYGCIEGGAVAPPPATAKVGRIPMRPGSCVGFANGRVLTGASTGVIYYTDPYDVDYMEEDNCRVPVGAIPTVILPVNNGVWVSTTKRVAFLKGMDPEDWSWEDAKGYEATAIMGAGIVTNMAALKRGGKEESVAVWASTRGVCLGTASGELINLSEGKFSYAPGQRGAILLRESEGLVHLVVTMQTVGNKYNKDTTDIRRDQTQLN